MHTESDYDLRAGLVLMLVHTIVCATIGYYLGYIGGMEEGSCHAACEEATAGQGDGHVVAGECECEIIDTAGEKTTWRESRGP